MRNPTHAPGRGTGRPRSVRRKRRTLVSNSRRLTITALWREARAAIRLVAALSFRDQLLEPQNRIWFLTSSFASPFEERRVRRAGRRGNTGHDIRVLHNSWSRKILTMRIVFAG